MKAPLLRLFFAMQLCSFVGGCTATKNQDMTAEEYFTRGVQMKQAGRIEESRKALKAAIEKDTQGVTARHAQVILKYKLPAVPITSDAEQRNVIGYNQLTRHETKYARQTFEKLIQDYPSFEWPYLNMAYIEAQSGDTDSAIGFAERAVSLNSNYAGAWTLLRKLYQAKGNGDGIARCNDRLAKIATELTDVTKAHDASH